MTNFSQPSREFIFLDCRHDFIFSDQMGSWWIFYGTYMLTQWTQWLQMMDKDNSCRLFSTTRVWDHRIFQVQIDFLWWIRIVWSRAIKNYSWVMPDYFNDKRESATCILQVEEFKFLSFAWVSVPHDDFRNISWVSTSWY